MEGNFKDDKPDGINKLYNEKGQLEKEVTYKDGKQEGIIREYYENGQLLSEGYFENDEPLEQTYYNEKGNKI